MKLRIVRRDICGLITPVGLLLAGYYAALCWAAITAMEVIGPRPPVVQVAAFYLVVVYATALPAHIAIHGRAAPALAFIRDEPAALVLFICYHALFLRVCMEIADPLDTAARAFAVGIFVAVGVVAPLLAVSYYYNLKDREAEEEKSIDWYVPAL